MPKIKQVNEIDITPEKFLSGCSREELLETDLLLSTARYQIEMHGTYTFECEVKKQRKQLKIDNQ